MDIAASIQVVTEEIVLKLVKYTKKITKSKKLCLGGGVALNCVINGKILGNNLVEDLWIQPAAGDAGNSLGCALNYYYQILNNKRNTKNKDLMSNSYLGPKFTNEEVKDYLDDLGAKYTFIQNEDKLLEIVSKELVDNKIIAWHQGRMEFALEP